jgi:hypothetical protein
MSEVAHREILGYVDPGGDGALDEQRIEHLWVPKNQIQVVTRTPAGLVELDPTLGTTCEKTFVLRQPSEGLSDPSSLAVRLD